MGQATLSMQSQSLASSLKQSFQKTFARTDQIFDLIVPEAYWMQPIGLRHPINFYEGHLPAFTWNTLFRNILGKGDLHPQWDTLFARGIDPANMKSARDHAIDSWPTQAQVRTYRNTIRDQLFQCLESINLEQVAHPLLQRGEIFFLLLEHELMHQETLLYMLHQLPHSLKQRDGSPFQSQPVSTAGTTSAHPAMIEIPAGIAVLGTMPGEFDYAWDNEMPRTRVEVGPFAMDTLNITNGQFLAFIEAGGYEDPSYWTPDAWAWKTQQRKKHPQFWSRRNKIWMLHDFYEDIPLPLDWPVYVTHAEASAYARFMEKSLPTESEWHRAAFGDKPADLYPWGNQSPTPEHGNFDFAHCSPVPVGSYPKGRSESGIQDLVGNGWEWTCTQFGPFGGFQFSEGYPQYSLDFFDAQHYVIKGGSCFTDARLLRRSFRNWYYWHYPYMYATFRCVVRR